MAFSNPPVLIYSVRAEAPARKSVRIMMIFIFYFKIHQLTDSLMMSHRLLNAFLKASETSQSTWMHTKPQTNINLFHHFTQIVAV